MLRDAKEIPSHHLHQRHSLLEPNEGGLNGYTQTGQPPLQAPKKMIHDAELGKAYANEYKICLRGTSSKSESKMFIELEREGMDGERFSPILSRLNKELRSQLEQVAEAYCVQKSHTRPVKYRLGIPAESIFIY